MVKLESFASLLSKEAARIVLPADERLKSYNLAHWFAQASKATRFCKHCDWPLEDWLAPGAATPTDDRCTVCVTMESAMYRSDYWRNIDTREASARRNKGLD